MPGLHSHRMEKSMVFLHQSGGMFNIAIQDKRTGQLSNLTTLGYTQSPRLAPNGKMVLYTKHTGVGNVLSLVSTDGRVRLRLPSRRGDVQEPAW